MLFRNEYAFLSNMYPVDVRLNSPDGSHMVTFRSAESAFQALKDPERFDEFVGLNGSSAKRLGRRVVLRPDWDVIKNDWMETIVRAKFQQHPDLAVKLANIDGPIAEDNTWGDTYWGRVNGQGENRLGVILESVRNEYKEIAPAPVRDSNILSLLKETRDLMQEQQVATIQNQETLETVKMSLDHMSQPDLEEAISNDVKEVPEMA